MPWYSTQNGCFSCYVRPAQQSNFGQYSFNNGTTTKSTEPTIELQPTPCYKTFYAIPRKENRRVFVKSILPLKIKYELWSIQLFPVTTFPKGSHPRNRPRKIFKMDFLPENLPGRKISVWTLLKSGWLVQSNRMQCPVIMVVQIFVECKVLNVRTRIYQLSIDPGWPWLIQNSIFLYFLWCLMMLNV